MSTHAICVTDLTFSFGEKKILSNLDLEIRTGDIMCIMGANGCGKTTLLNCILGFYAVAPSHIVIDGTDITRISRQEIARRISYTQQMLQNDSMLDVFDYLTLGRIAYKKLTQRINSVDMEIIRHAVDMLGIQHLLNKSMDQLSGGERQMVMICRSLVQNTPVIIMDEPASALDFGNQAILLRTIRQLQRNGKTVVFSTHNPNHALALRSKVCLIDQGHVLSVGDAHSSLNEELLYRAYGEKLRFLTDDNLMACTFEI